MASYHLSVKTGGKGSASPHADYISREGKYAREKDSDLEHKESGNMPAWAAHKPTEFWKAADTFERANGCTYREIEIALPRELKPEQRLELVRDFVRQEIGDRHAYQFAIHNPKAAIAGGEQPHAHIMFSERMNDGIDRDPQQYFKRANSKAPERGGAKKARFGETIDLKSDPKLCSGQYCFDQVLLNKLDKILAVAPSQDTVIFLHIIGSHGPTYYLRYPPEHRKFIPDCPRSDIQNCSQEELINTYDNTILYTDFILSEVVNKLKGKQDMFDTAMLYLSDHGESLGEKGMYLHGAPYSIAPKEQTSVPMLAWVSNDFSQDNQLNMTCVAQRAEQGGFSHDNLFDSLLGLMNVKTTVYQSQLDIFAPCRY